jgi:hypothetical protein
VALERLRKRLISGAGKLSDRAITRSPGLSPETTSANLGSLKPTTIRLHCQPGPFVAVVTTGGEGLVANPSNRLEWDASHPMPGLKLEIDFGAETQPAHVKGVRVDANGREIDVNG